jgi:hypothetical protein
MYKSFQNSKWLFEKPGDNEYLYRAVPERVQILLQPLINAKNIVDYEALTETIDVGPHTCDVYKIPRLPFQIRIQELTRSMAKEVVLCLIDLVIQSIEGRVAIFDINESNILYWNNPVWVDLDSFRVPNAVFYSGAVARISYLYNKYVLRKKINTTAGYYKLSMMRAAGGLFGDIAKSLKTVNWSKKKPWLNLKKLVGATTIAPRQSGWSKNYARNYEDHQKIMANNIKIKNAMKMICALGPKTLLDIGCNKGYLCSIASQHINNAVGFDIDEKCIDIANDINRRNAKINFANFGIMHLSNKKYQFRYRADCVVALAMTHHFKNAKLDPVDVASIIANLADKWIIIEDIAQTNAYHSTFKANGFKRIETVESRPKSRKISLFGKTPRG